MFIEADREKRRSPSMAPRDGPIASPLETLGTEGGGVLPRRDDMYVGAVSPCPSSRDEGTRLCSAYRPAAVRLSRSCSRQLQSRGEALLRLARCPRPSDLLRKVPSSASGPGFHDLVGSPPLFAPNAPIFFAPNAAEGEKKQHFSPVAVKLARKARKTLLRTPGSSEGSLGVIHHRLGEFRELRSGTSEGRPVRTPRRLARWVVGRA